MRMFLFLLMISMPVLAIEKITIQNLDLEYNFPYGTGTLEKISLGANLRTETYPVEIFRRETTIDVVAPFVTFEWLSPIKFVHHLQQAAIGKLNLKLEKGESSLSGEKLKVLSEKGESFVVSQYDFACSGPSTKTDPIDRLKQDCLVKMRAQAKHLELPFEVLKNIADQLPDEDTETQADMPVNNFSLSVNDGDIYSYLRIKFIVRAYLKIWAHAQYEDNGNTFAIRVDTIKFGILPVTHLVLSELKRSIQSSNVTIDPPWIRIKL